MAIDKARNWLKKYNLVNKIKELSVTTATVKDAAIAIGTEEARIAKTISFKVNDKAILIVCAGDTKIDNVKYKVCFGVKAKMLEFNEVETLIGHAVGGVCPFGINEDVLVYLDSSLKRFDIVYPACGSSNSMVELSIEELEKCSNYVKWIDVCKVKDSN